MAPRSRSPGGHLYLVRRKSVNAVSPKRRTPFLVCSLAASLTMLTSCASTPLDTSGGGGSSVSSDQCRLEGCPVVDDAGAGGPQVSFRQDLMPAIQRNCSDAPCHGKEVDGAAELFLGPPLPAAVDVSSVIRRIVGVSSRTAPELRLIAPGDPENSFLLLKVEGCQNTGGLTCQALLGARSGQPCGDTMPQAARPLCNKERANLRSWIRQGAQDD
jgi:hypothetical protein